VAALETAGKINLAGADGQFAVNQGLFVPELGQIYTTIAAGVVVDTEQITDLATLGQPVPITSLGQCEDRAAR